jgi:hypothetical protein
MRKVFIFTVCKIYAIEVLPKDQKEKKEAVYNNLDFKDPSCIYPSPLKSE